MSPVKVFGVEYEEGELLLQTVLAIFSTGIGVSGFASSVPHAVQKATGLAKEFLQAIRDDRPPDEPPSNGRPRLVVPR